MLEPHSLTDSVVDLPDVEDPFRQPSTPDTYALGKALVFDEKRHCGSKSDCVLGDTNRALSPLTTSLLPIASAIITGRPFDIASKALFRYAYN
jgi:hypothetical protein